MTSRPRLNTRQAPPREEKRPSPPPTQTQSLQSAAGVTMNVTPGSCTAEMPPGFLPRLRGLYIAAELLIAALAIVGNLLVCLAVTRNKRLRTVTNYFLVSLAVSDILVGLVAIPCAVLTDLGEPQHDLPLCLVLLSILIVLTQSSILSLLAVAAERYMAILLPFQYQRMMSPRNAQVALLLTWGLGAITGTVPLMDWRRQSADSDYCIFTCVVDMSYMVYFNFFCCLLLPLVAMVVIYGHIFLTVRRQLRRIAAVRGKAGDARAGASGSEETTASSAAEGGETGSDGKRESVADASGFGIPSSPADPAPKSKPSIRQEMRKATSLFLVLVLFTVCWLPIHLINCVLLLCPRCPVPMSLTLAAILLSHANSALNPILYAYRMRSFRHTLLGMWRGVWRPGPKQQ